MRSQKALTSFPQIRMFEHRQLQPTNWNMPSGTQKQLDSSYNMTYIQITMLPTP